MNVTITIPLPPKGKGRPRFSRHGGAYTDKATRDWERSCALLTVAALREATGGLVRIEGPVRVDIMAIKRRPETHQNAGQGLLWRPVVPDADNVRKAVLDALTATRLWRNDAQVVCGDTLSLYGEPGQPGRLVIHISTELGSVTEMVEALGIQEAS